MTKQTEASTVVTTRHLFKCVREAIGQARPDSERLGALVDVIADIMGSDVCSIYRRRGMSLVLVASKGLQPSVVGNLVIGLGEGLVGHVAEGEHSIILKEAHKDPRFLHVPETGEDAYQSFIGVPIGQGRRNAGVLVLQNLRPEIFNEENIENLETVALILAELFGQEKAETDQGRIDKEKGQSLSFNGICLVEGFAVGPALFRTSLAFGEISLSEDHKAERARIDEALARIDQAIGQMLKKIRTRRVSGEHIEILETYRLFVGDKGFRARIFQLIDEKGFSAPSAVMAVLNDIRGRMQSFKDSHMRERLFDVEDFCLRLLRYLQNEGVKEEIPKGSVLVARRIGPADLMEYDPGTLGGLILEEGSRLSHVSIMAKALDIPTISGVNLWSCLSLGDPIAMDAGSGLCVVRPDKRISKGFANNIKLKEREREEFLQARDLKAETLDQQPIELLGNVGMIYEVDHMLEMGGDGVGLCRTEIPFLMSDKSLNLLGQIRLYRAVLAKLEGRRAVFRTLDIGGDKIMPHMRSLFPSMGSWREENPAMGFRAIRIGLQKPALLRQQLRALLLAARGQSIEIMFPMIANREEWNSARHIVMLEVEKAKRRGVPLPLDLKIGLTLEVPSMVFDLEAICAEKQIDFISVGTNDLFQFLFASDRGSLYLDGRYDNLSPPAVQVLEHIAIVTKKYGVRLSICGQMAASLLDVMALIGLGYHSFSVPPLEVGRLRRMVRSIDGTVIEGFMQKMASRNYKGLREQLKLFAEEQGVRL